MFGDNRLFCTWCEAFIPNPKIGKKAGLVRRWFATAIDPLLAIILYLIVIAVFGGVAGVLGGSAMIGSIIIVTIGYGAFYIRLLSKGMTPGKWLLGEQVVEKTKGDFPGFGRMICGKLLESL